MFIITNQAHWRYRWWNAFWYGLPADAKKKLTDCALKLIWTIRNQIVDELAKSTSKKSLIGSEPAFGLTCDTMLKISKSKFK